MALQTASFWTYGLQNGEKRNFDCLGSLGGLVSSASDFGQGHDLMVCGFEPRVGLCADSLDPGACFGFCVSLSLCPSSACSFSQK